MSSYRLTHEGKTYEFEVLADAQELLDKLPSRAGVEIIEAPLLFQLLNAPGAPLTNWQEIIEEINVEFDRVKTEDSRIALLATFKAVMDIAETTVAPEQLSIFRDARQKHYNSFIVQEALVGQNVCIETLYAVTGREVNAGRMAPDHELRKAAEMGMAAPHLSRAELMATASTLEVKPTSIWQRLLTWVRHG